MSEKLIVGYRPVETAAVTAAKLTAAGQTKRAQEYRNADKSAAGFEALLASQMLKAMRATTEQSSEQKTWLEMQDTALAEALAARGALGIKGLVERELVQQLQRQSATGVTEVGNGKNR
jgi:Rod binding domain-containing protein